jgi:hypothetical protein
MKSVWVLTAEHENGIDRYAFRTEEGAVRRAAELICKHYQLADAGTKEAIDEAFRKRNWMAVVHAWSEFRDNGSYSGFYNWELCKVED